MGYTERELLSWMVECAEARDTNPRAKTVNLKFTRATLRMWVDRVREAQCGGSAADEIIESTAHDDRRSQ